MMTPSKFSVEWPTFLALVLCYAAFGAVLFSDLPLWLSMVLLSVIIAFQSSLQHEVIHGHPTPIQWLNAAMVWPSLNVAVPYARFRDTHLAHHKNENLTDPYDDPESNYLSPAGWAVLCWLRRPVLRANTTLLGRMVFGPAISQVYFMIGDVRAIRAGSRRIALQWVGHGLSLLPVFWLLSLTDIPIWGYLLSAYGGLGLLKIRTYAEHQAHQRIGGRSVVIEDRGPLALLFLNNNYHAVHHMHPQIAWYRLPQVYRSRRARFLRYNQGYRFGSYKSLFARYLLRGKEPVIHPHWQEPDR